MGLGQKLLGVLGLHLFMKILSFALTISITRAVLPRHKGLAFAFDFYLNAGLFLAKEAVRNVNGRMSMNGTRGNQGTSMGNTTSPSRRLSLLIEIGCVPLVIFCILVLPLCVAHAAFFQPGEFLDVCSGAVVFLYLVGAIFELSAEPALAVLIYFEDYGARVFSEGFAVLTRLLTTIVTILIALRVAHKSDDTTITLCYAAGFAASGFAAFGLSWFRILRRRRATTPEAVALSTSLYDCFLSKGVLRTITAGISHVSFWDSSGTKEGGRATVGTKPNTDNQWPLFSELFSESVLRMVLTEAEKAVLTAYGDLAAQGIFDTVASLAAMVVRLLFRPGEDFALAVWSRGESEKKSTTNESTTSQAQIQERVEKVSLLHTMVRAMSTLGIIALAVGPPLAFRFLSIFYGKDSEWASPLAVLILSLYCAYLPLLGVNGLLEAFVRGTSDLDQLSRVKFAMLWCSIAYSMLCVFALKQFGVPGLVVANCANVSIRIAVSFWFIQRTFSLQREWRDSVVAMGLSSSSFYSWVLPLLPPTVVVILGLTVSGAAWGLSRGDVTIFHLPFLGSVSQSEAVSVVGAVVLFFAWIASDMTALKQLVKRKQQ